MNEPKTILQEAADAVGGDRRRDYGDARVNLQRIADIWNVQLGRKLTVAITAREVALMMIGTKLAREINTPKRDNLVDIAGYAECAGMCVESEQDRYNAVIYKMGRTCCGCGVKMEAGTWAVVTEDSNCNKHFLCSICLLKFSELEWKRHVGGTSPLKNCFTENCLRQKNP